MLTVTCQAEDSSMPKTGFQPDIPLKVEATTAKKSKTCPGSPSIRLGVMPLCARAIFE